MFLVSQSEFNWRLCVTRSWGHEGHLQVKTSEVAKNRETGELKTQTVCVEKMNDTGNHTRDEDKT